MHSFLLSWPWPVRRIHEQYIRRCNLILSVESSFCNFLCIVHVFDELAKVTRGETCACASLSKTCPFSFIGSCQNISITRTASASLRETLGWFSKTTGTWHDDGAQSKCSNMVNLEQNPDYSARPHVVIWHSRPVAKSATYWTNTPLETHIPGKN